MIPNRVTQEVCCHCGKAVTVIGKGEWDERIQAFEWYESDHFCPKLEGADEGLKILSSKLMEGK